MNLLERVLTLIRANLTTVVEKSEDPEKILRQLQTDMRNQLVQVKTQVATAIAEGHKLQKRSKERSVEAEHWMEKAEQAIQHGNDDVARSALTRYNDITKQAQRYLQQQKEQEQIVTTMRGALRQLEAKIAEVDTTIDLLVARKRSAQLQQRVFDALNKTGNANDNERTAKAQDAVLEAEARARALADLHKRKLDTQLEQLSEEQIVEQQMRDLKRRSNASQESRLLTENSDLQVASLLAPQPQMKTPAKKRLGEQNKYAAEPIPQKDGDTERLKKLIETKQNTEL